MIVEFLLLNPAKTQTHCFGRVCFDLPTNYKCQITHSFNGKTDSLRYSKEIYTHQTYTEIKNSLSKYYITKDTIFLKEGEGYLIYSVISQENYNLLELSLLALPIINFSNRNFDKYKWKVKKKKDIIIYSYTNKINNKIISNIIKTRDDTLIFYSEFFRDGDLHFYSWCTFETLNSLKNKESTINRNLPLYHHTDTTIYELLTVPLLRNINLESFMYLDGTEPSPKFFDTGIVVLDFYNWRCKPCVEAIPWLNNQMKTYPSIRFYGLNPSDLKPVQNHLDFVEKYNVHYPILITTRNDKGPFSDWAYPTIVILKNGEIIGKWTGYNDATKKAIEEFLKKLEE